MSDNGHAAEVPSVVQPTPVQFSVNCTKIGTASLPSGDEVALVRLVFFTPVGQTVLFMNAADALDIANTIREQASGITIAHDLGGIQ